MYRRILVPVDGSAPSLVGLRHALELAREQGAHVRVLNVLDDRVDAPVLHGGGSVGTLLETTMAEGRRALDDALAAAHAADVSADAVVVASAGGDVAEAILDQAARWRADLIVMGTHGRRGLSRLLLGSHAERVLREAPVPVLIVRDEEGESVLASAP
jgi:nucleotide-binding universal stress UspA family protein